MLYQKESHSTTGIDLQSQLGVGREDAAEAEGLREPNKSRFHCEFKTIPAYISRAYLK